MADSRIICIFASRKDKEMKTAVIYARVSSVDDRQNTDRQVADLKSYAANKYEVLNVFTEHMSGARKNEERRVLCDCLEYCFTQKIHTLLISELSRLGRNVDEVLANVRICKENNLNIYFQKENLSLFQSDGTKNPFLNIFISVLGTCAELERENIAFRLNSGRKQAIARGVKMGRKQGSVKTHEQKASEYRDVIKCLRKGLSVASTFAVCRQKGVKCSVSTIKRLKKEFLT